MAEIVIIIMQNKDGVLDGLKVKATLEKLGLEVLGVITKETKGNVVPKELIESIMKIKVLNTLKVDG